jgi:hypothetical protein
MYVYLFCMSFKCFVLYVSSLTCYVYFLFYCFFSLIVFGLSPAVSLFLFPQAVYSFSCAVLLCLALSLAICRDGHHYLKK